MRSLTIHHQCPRCNAKSNSSPRFITEVVRHRGLLQLGALTHGSSGWTIVWLEIALSSTTCERSWPARQRLKDPTLDPESDWKSEILGIDSISGRKVVGHNPEATEPERVLVLAIDQIVRIEPVGDWVSD